MDVQTSVQKCSTCSRDFHTTKRVPPYFCEECRDQKSQGSGASIWDIFVGCCSLGRGIGHVIDKGEAPMPEMTFSNAWEAPLQDTISRAASRKGRK
eukprot:698023-Amphidinium_carterae.1